jgi:hypothetical protein
MELTGQKPSRQKNQAIGEAAGCSDPHFPKVRLIIGLNKKPQVRFLTQKPVLMAVTNARANQSSRVQALNVLSSLFGNIALISISNVDFFTN